MTGSQVRQLRQQLDLTQVQLGELVGVSGNSVARWERNELGIRESAARLMRLLAQQRTGQGIGSSEATAGAPTALGRTAAARVSLRRAVGRTDTVDGGGDLSHGPTRHPPARRALLPTAGRSDAADLQVERHR